MTAPGQEPDEVMTAKPDGQREETPDEKVTRDPDLDAVGDNHMPEDLRESVRERSEQMGDRDDT